MQSDWSPTQGMVRSQSSQQPRGPPAGGSSRRSKPGGVQVKGQQTMPFRRPASDVDDPVVVLVARRSRTLPGGGAGGVREVDGVDGGHPRPTPSLSGLGPGPRWAARPCPGRTSEKCECAPVPVEPGPDGSTDQDHCCGVRVPCDDAVGEGRRRPERAVTATNEQGPPRCDVGASAGPRVPHTGPLRQPSKGDRTQASQASGPRAQ